MIRREVHKVMRELAGYTTTRRNMRSVSERVRTGAPADAMTMTSRREAARLNKTISEALAGMIPPDDLTVTEWAEQNRRLSSEASAEPGPWRTERTPYLREVMDTFTDPKVRHTVMVAGVAGRQV